MKGSSGADLEFSGDFVLKSCSDAVEQCEWFQSAQEKRIVKGIRLPRVDPMSQDSYRIEFIQGTSATKYSSTLIIDTLLDQILVWSKLPSGRSAGWSSYVRRLYDEHVVASESDVVLEAFQSLEKAEPLPSSFSHGDLTLENVIIEPDGNLVLIDPNYKRNLFQSHILDLGKLLQSVHMDYHRVFQSHPGVDPEPLCSHLRGRLGELLWGKSLLAEMSHFIRLRKYRTIGQRGKVDSILSTLLKEYKLSL